MEFLSIVGVLGQRRVLVALGALFALLVGAMATGLLPFGPGSSTAKPAGTAQTRVILDHRVSVVVDLVKFPDTVGSQAAVLADIMGGDRARDAIAARAGVPVAELGMLRVQLGKVVARGQLAQRAAEVSAGIARPHVVSVWAASPLPILTIDVIAPSRAHAARLALATRQTLQAFVAQRAPSEARSIVVRQLGPVRSAELKRAKRPPVVGVAVGIAFLVLWCCAVVVLHGLLRVWRDATARPAPAAAR